MGLRFTAVTETEAIEEVLDELDAERGGWVCPVNVDVLRQVTASADLGRLVATADLVVVDGMPVVWASRLAGRRVPERVAGSSLISSLSSAAGRRGRSVYLLGGNRGTASAAAEILRAQSPGLTVAGTYCPPQGFEHDAAEMRRIRDELRATRPDIVFVGVGFPKQDRLITELRPDLPETWFMSCGISFSFLAGEVSRAPRLMQKVGLEWLHRMLQEPSRLVRRYLWDGIPFALRLLGWSLRQRRP
jgi:N-acetylglucosaminyldiphosphoundecaprenol N-acetyl-beta-D-mannosaminyltransferase